MTKEERLEDEANLTLDESRGLRRLKQLAEAGLKLSDEGKFEESYSILREIETLLPRLAHDINLELEEEAAAEQAGKVENEAKKEWQKEKKTEARIDMTQVNILQKINNKFRAMDRYISKKGIKKNTKDMLLKRMDEIKKELGRIIGLERLKISEETKENNNFTKKYANQKIKANEIMRGLIRQETNLLPALKKMIDDIENLIKNSGPAMSVVGLVRRAIDINKELIKVATAELRQIRGK